MPGRPSTIPPTGSAPANPLRNSSTPWPNGSIPYSPSRPFSLSELVPLPLSGPLPLLLLTHQGPLLLPRRVWLAAESARDLRLLHWLRACSSLPFPSLPFDLTLSQGPACHLARLCEARAAKLASASPTPSSTPSSSSPPSPLGALVLLAPFESIRSLVSTFMEAHGGVWGPAARFG